MTRARACSRHGARVALACLALLAAAAHGEDCFDRNIDCGEWAEDGGCDDAETRDWMRTHCPAACGGCPDVVRRATPRAPTRAPTRAPVRRAEL